MDKKDKNIKMNEENRKKAREGLKIILDQELSLIKEKVKEKATSLHDYTIPFLNFLGDKLTKTYLSTEDFKRYNEEYLKNMGIEE